MERYSRTFLLTLLTILFIAPSLALAQEFVPLVGVPGVEPNTQKIDGYINALYFLSIGLAAAFAVVRIIYAGVQLMFSETPSARSDAKKSIGGALLGLILVLGAVTLLDEVNPNLKNFDIFGNAEPIKVEVPPSAPANDPCSDPYSYTCVSTKCQPGESMKQDAQQRWVCVGQEENPVGPSGADWIVTDSSVVEWFRQNLCAGTDCELVFVSHYGAVPEEEQRAACTDLGGTLGVMRPYNGSVYNYCRILY